MALEVFGIHQVKEGAWGCGLWGFLLVDEGWDLRVGCAWGWP